MNKWIILFATILVTLGFSSTIQITIANPSGSNLAISGGLLIVMLIGIWLFFKSGKTKQTKIGNEEFTPVE